MKKTEVLSTIRSSGVIPVLRAATGDEAEQAIAAIVAGGITVIEITMTTPSAIDLIDKYAAQPGLLVGAGTVLDAETARECINAGAKFIISPSTDLDVIDHCREKDTAVMPGALTPTEIVNAWQAGADIIKVFPAGALGGASYLRSIKAPLPEIKLIPTGGVDLSNAAEMIKAGAEAIGVGSDLVDLKAIREGRPEEVTRTAAEYLRIVQNERQRP